MKARYEKYLSNVSTHSRLKAAGAIIATTDQPIYVSTHSRLKAAGHWLNGNVHMPLFQHTAA